MEFVHVSHAKNHMATTFDLRISCARSSQGRADRVLTEAHQKIAQLELELSEYLEVSPVYRLNHSDPGVPIEASPSLLKILDLARTYFVSSGGRFDPTVKSLGQDGLGFLDRIHWNTTLQIVSRQTPDARLGFGAIGKGFALDEVRLLFEQAGFHDFLLSAGGSSLVFSGMAGPTTPWTWAWSWSLGDEPLVLKNHRGHAIAVGVSGLEEKGAHLLNPPSIPVGEDLSQSALVTHGSASAADAYSTALFVGGWKEFDSDSGVALVTQNHVIRWNVKFGAFLASLALLYVIPARAEEGELDLGQVEVKAFQPYTVERNLNWIALPFLCFLVLLLHLSRTKKRKYFR